MNNQSELEKVSDELQQQQLLYFETELSVSEEDRDEEYYKWMDEQRKLIDKLIASYDALKSK